MINKGVRWNESETKKIYNANKETEMLMEYLEERLFAREIVDNSADSPTPHRGFGRMIYYSGSGRVLDAAPRKRYKHIHVVLSNKINMAEVKKAGIKTGNGKTDVMLTSNEEIDKLVSILEAGWEQPGGVKEEAGTYKTRTLEDWLQLYEKDEAARFREHFILYEREAFISNFTELDELRNGAVNLGEFKKILDQKTKTKLELEGNRVNLWGFSGFSGQMFFNQLYNMAEYTETVEELTTEILDGIQIPDDHEEGDFNWTREKLGRFGEYIKTLKKRAIEQGFPPKRCPNIRYMTFFLSFFWGIQGMEKYPIYYKASRDGLEYLGYSLAEDAQAAEHHKYNHFVDKLSELLEDMQKFRGEKYMPDMMFLSSFLYYVTSSIEAERDTEDDDKDPIINDEFALQIRDVLFEEGYKFSQMKTADPEETGLEEEYTGSLIWQYSGESKEDVAGLLIIWESEETYNADLRIENEEGDLLRGKSVDALDDVRFLNELRGYLQKRGGVRKPYTIDDAVRETYVSKESMEEWLELLSEKRQVIFYGPPGTGKTFIAQRLAKILTQHEQHVKLIQFHPSYTYEEFMEGLRPELTGEENKQLSVKVEPGIFSMLCDEARKPENQEKSYILIIDEINRANTAKVFGELLYALEYRNTPVPLAYSKKKLIVPDNIYLIGTMNTTDRSLAQIDFALRRRFQFIPFSAKETESVLKNYLLDNEPEMAWVADLVNKVNDMIDDPDISIGHSYFIGQELTMAKLKRIWKYQITPYLEECFVHDRQRLEQFQLESLLETGVEEDE